MAVQPNQPNPSQAGSAQVSIQMFYNGRSSIDGIGSFARVGILRGHLIHLERPFLYLCSDEDPISPQNPQDPQWQTWLGLRAPGTSLPEIFRTTSIRCGVKSRSGQQVEVSGVFLQAVRFNSSCQPNIHAHWNETRRWMEFRAFRDIAVDDELCLCYDPPTLLYSTLERQQRLLTKFGFHCNCAGCTQTTPGLDQQRTKLRGRIEAGVPTVPSSAQEVSTNHSVGNGQTDREKLENFIHQKTGAIDDLRRTGLYHFADTLHYDLHLAQRQAGRTNVAVLCLLTARNLVCLMVGTDDPRVVQMTAALPPSLQNDYGLVCRAGCCQLDAEMKDHTIVPKVQAAYHIAEQEDTHVDSPNIAGEPPISLQDDMDIDRPGSQAEILAVKREHADTDDPNTHTAGLVRAQDSLHAIISSSANWETVDLDLDSSASLDSRRTPQGASFSLRSRSGSSSPLISDPVDSQQIDKALEKAVECAKATLPLRSSSPKAAHGKPIKIERGRAWRVQGNSSIVTDLEEDVIYQEDDGIPDLSGRVELCQLRPVFNGQYSAVYQGKIGQQLVAVKVLKEIHGAETHTMRRKLERERKTWGRLRHRNILPLYGFANDHELFQPFGAFISPWRPQGNAHQFLEKRGRDLSTDQRLDLWKRVVAGVAYLHNHKPLLVHGDLKAANILIDNDDQPQLCDFGLVSILLEEGNSGMTTTSQHTGTDRYLAYELLNEKTLVPTTASDIYALGCTGLEFYFSQIPHARHKNNMRGQIFTAIKAGIPPATRARPCDPQSEAFWDLLDKCWTPGPSDRPKAEQLLAELQLPPFTTTSTGKGRSVSDLITASSTFNSTPASATTSTPLQANQAPTSKSTSATPKPSKPQTQSHSAPASGSSSPHEAVQSYVQSQGAPPVQPMTPSTHPSSSHEPIPSKWNNTSPLSILPAANKYTGVEKYEKYMDSRGRRLSNASQLSEHAVLRSPSAAGSASGGEGRGKFSLRELLSRGPKLSRKDTASSKGSVYSGQRSEHAVRSPSAAGSASGGEGRGKFSLRELLSRRPTLSRNNSASLKGSVSSVGGGGGRGKSASNGGSANGSKYGSAKGSESVLERKYGIYGKMAVGKGVASVIRLAHKWDRTEEKLYAVKEFRPRRNKESERDYVKKLTSEFCIASVLRQPNVVETVDLMQDDAGKWCVVMEFCPGGDLYNAIRKGGMSPAEVECCFKQILMGVGYLHAQGVAHRDLKPENLFFDARGQVKIGDFGASTVFRLPWEQTIHKSGGLCGSEPYIAPEQFAQPVSYDARLVDVWACGIVYYCLHFSELPWSCAQPSDKTYVQYAQQCASPGFAIANIPFLKTPVNHSGVGTPSTPGPGTPSRQDSSGSTLTMSHVGMTPATPGGMVTGSGLTVPNSPFEPLTPSGLTTPFDLPIQSRAERDKEHQREQAATYPSTIHHMSPLACRPVLRRMLEPKPEYRVTIEEVLQHPWVQSIEVCTLPGVVPKHIHPAAIATAAAGGIVADKYDK